MSYAPDHRPYYDADSHIMELPDFLRAYADPEIRDEIPLVDYTASIVTDEEVAEIVDQRNRHSDEHRAAQIALGDDLIAKIQAAFTKLDASNPEHKAVLDAFKAEKFVAAESSQWQMIRDVMKGLQDKGQLK